jgi:hypothetical protein
MRRELDEDGGDEVEARRPPVPGGKVGAMRLERHAAASGEPARLGDGHRREIDRDDIEPLLGKPDAVAAFPVRHRQRLHAGGEPVALRGEEGIGRGAEEIVLAFEPRIPSLAFRLDRHGSLSPARRFTP